MAAEINISGWLKKARQFHRYGQPLMLVRRNGWHIVSRWLEPIIRRASVTSFDNDGGTLMSR